MNNFERNEKMNCSAKTHKIALSPTIEVDSLAKKLKAEGVDVVSFGAGEPDFDTPSNIKEAAKKALDEGYTKYTPASGLLSFREAICTKLRNENGLMYTPDEIVVSNGAKHSLWNTFLAILDPGDEVIVPAPYWVSYPEMIKMADGVPVIVNADESMQFKVTPQLLNQAYTQKTKALILNSPSNPTGMMYTRQEMEAIAEWVLEKNIIVISDEIYETLAYDGVSHISIAALSEEIKNQTILINGLSKAYAMTGWRIGYAAAPKNIAKGMGNLQSHGTSNPNSIAQMAGIEALLGEKSTLLTMREAFQERRNYMVDTINQMPLFSCIKPSGAFYVMMNVSGCFGKTYKGEVIQTAKAFTRHLLEGSHVAVVPGEAFGAPNHVRLSFATSMQEIEKGLNRIASFGLLLESK